MVQCSPSIPRARPDEPRMEVAVKAGRASEKDSPQEPRKWPLRLAQCACLCFCPHSVPLCLMLRALLQHTL